MKETTTPVVEPTTEKPRNSEPAEVHIQQGAASTAGWHIKAFRLLIRTLFHLFFRVRIKGLKNVPSTPAIVCANHLGWADPFLILLFFPVEPRVYILGQEDVREISGFRKRVINWLEIMVPLDLEKPLQALRIMKDVLQRGGSLLIFPEGHLGEREGELLELQHGASHLSLTTGAPLVPVGLTGTQDLWLRRKLVMRVGKPIYPAEFEGATRARMHAMTARLDKEMRALLPGDRERARVKLLRRWLTKLL
jgi:1-acyl-sn-glycerol-3-phosphate acyltransferase